MSRYSDDTSSLDDDPLICGFPDDNKVREPLVLVRPEERFGCCNSHFKNESITAVISYLSTLVQQWGHSTIRKFAQSFIPKAEIQLDADAESVLWERSNKSDCDNYTYHVIYLQKLLNWFRSFFKWMQIPSCRVCLIEMALRERIESTSVISATVEIYICPKCHRKEFLNRYVDPCVLLRTKEGRCSEFATLFTVMCMSLNFKARYIFDFSDHCWTEVYHPPTRKWIHIDPSEGIIDKPLIYDLGWKKKISYILAFGITDVQDVTWRYASDHRAVISRRTLENQNHLIKEIVRVRQILLEDYQYREDELKMVLTELAGLMIIPVPSEGEEFPPQDLEKYNVPATEVRTDLRGEHSSKEG